MAKQPGAPGQKDDIIQSAWECRRTRTGLENAPEEMNSKDTRGESQRVELIFCIAYMYTVFKFHECAQVYVCWGMGRDESGKAPGTHVEKLINALFIPG